jgi:hypothetical protein
MQECFDKAWKKFYVKGNDPNSRLKQNKWVQPEQYCNVFGWLRHWVRIGNWIY